ncbi:hypothetical protein QWE_10737 [Agrobacterium albertimagni AOL15]|uniref:YjiS-like domain-containing protein n=2 Tax=Agrobacterium albertimagni TaxID=147266 RepID=K2Q7J7_9HYPH|nr:hypothetical protein QWE_10737 [Agrobacterium albertimagni AOL15]
MVTMETIGPKAGCDGIAVEVRGDLSSPVRSFGERLKLWWRRRKTRAHLSQLTEEQLLDVGLSPEMASREISKSRLLLLDRPVQPPF